MAIAQHLPCLGLLLGVSAQHPGPYASYRATHRSTLSSQASGLSWVSRQRRQESLGSESEMVRMPALGPRWLAIPSSTRSASGLWAELPLKLQNHQDTGTLAGKAPPSLPSHSFFRLILPDRQGRYPAARPGLSRGPPSPAESAPGWHHLLELQMEKTSISSPR